MPKTLRNANGPVIVIGLDGADANLIERYIEEDKLPVLRQLQQKGCWGRLTREGDLFSENVWPDFLTGAGVSYHGMAAWAQLKPGTYDVEATNAETAFRNRLPFYARLKDPDRRVVIVDVPKTHTIEGLNGAQVCAWGAHSHAYRPSSYPGGVYRDVESRFGKSTMRDKDEDDRADNEYFSALLEWLRKTPEQRARMCAYLYREYSPIDLLLTVFSETHSVGHRFWHFMDETHPHYDPAAPEAFKNAILEIYQACDQAIGLLLENVPKESTVLVFSTHGMAQNAHDVSSMHLLPEFLYRFSFPDYQKNDQNVRNSFLQKSRDLLPVKFRNSFKHLVPLPFRAHIHMKRIGRAIYKDLWPEMKAFSLYSASSGYIRFNLKGREPHGIVEPTQYDQLCEELTEQLVQLVEPRSGKSAVNKIHRRREHHKGSFAEQIMPDLFVEWADLSIEALHSPKYGDMGPIRMERTGSHRPHGIFFAHGSDLPNGQRIDGGHTKDLTPTILSLIGEPVPEDIEGHTLLSPI